MLFANGTGPITLVADANAEGLGDVVMLDMQDILQTNGRDLIISGDSLILGLIDTSVQPNFIIDVDAGGAIPPAGTRGTADFTFTVDDEANNISDLDVRFSASHTWDADLDVFLTSPNGTTLELFSDVGGNADNFQDTVLDDAASVSIDNGNAPFNGRFQPEGGRLAIFDGESATGTWVLEVIDDGLGDTGTLFEAGAVV